MRHRGVPLPSPRQSGPRAEGFRPNHYLLGDSFASLCIATTHRLSLVLGAWLSSTRQYFPRQAVSLLLLATGVQPSTCLASASFPQLYTWRALGCNLVDVLPTDDHHVSLGRFSVHSALPPQQLPLMRYRLPPTLPPAYHSPTRTRHARCASPSDVSTLLRLQQHPR